jgi:hypothetical protein
MTFGNRLRLIFGIIFVVAIVVALAFYLTSIMSVAKSSKAELDAAAISIGTDYPGLIVKQNVEEGDKVTKGQTLFEIQSAPLNEVLTNGTVLASSLPFKVDPKTNYIQLKASDDGVVDKISYRAGSYVPVGGIVATVYTVNTLFVTANFRLSPPDYARIDKSSKIDLRMPDNTTQQATIFSIGLVRNGDSVDTVIKARLKNADITDFRFSVGTPVDATMQLGKISWYQGLVTYVEQLFKPLGK